MTILERMVGAARLDSHAYEDVERDSSATSQALLIVLAVAILSGVGQYLTGDISVLDALILGATRGVAWWALSAFFIWFVGSTILRGPNTEANWGQLARTIGFAQTPGLFNILTAIPVVGILLGLALFVWNFAANIVAVRQALDYDSSWRAFFVVALAWIPTVLIFVFFVLVPLGLLTE